MCINPTIVSLRLTRQCRRSYPHDTQPQILYFHQHNHHGCHHGCQHKGKPEPCTSTLRLVVVGEKLLGGGLLVYHRGHRCQVVLHQHLVVLQCSTVCVCVRCMCVCVCVCVSSCNYLLTPSGGGAASRCQCVPMRVCLQSLFNLYVKHLPSITFIHSRIHSCKQCCNNPFTSHAHLRPPSQPPPPPPSILCETSSTIHTYLRM